MTETTIGLLRHGQTDWNIDFRLQGTTDIPMNKLGLEQARRAAEAISDDWDVILASPLDRAIKTAQFAAERLSLELQIEPLLIERNFGEAEGMKYDEWREHYPDGVVPGGETVAELEIRCHRLLERLLTRHQGQKALAVSHGSLIRKLLEMVSGGELPRVGERLGNASLSMIQFDGHKWSILDYRPQTLS